MMARLCLFSFVIVSFLSFPDITRADAGVPTVDVLSKGKTQLLIRVSQNVSGERGWQRRVELVVPRREAVVAAAKIISYNSATEFNNGDSSYQSSPPRFGFLLFG